MAHSTAAAPINAIGLSRSPNKVTPSATPNSGTRYSEADATVTSRNCSTEYLAAGQTHLDVFTPVRPEAVYPVRGAARYAVEENQRIRLFMALAAAAHSEGAAARSETSFELMGELMYQSH